MLYSKNTFYNKKIFIIKKLTHFNLVLSLKLFCYTYTEFFVILYSFRIPNFSLTLLFISFIRCTNFLFNNITFFLYYVFPPSLLSIPSHSQVHIWSKHVSQFYLSPSFSRWTNAYIKIVLCRRLLTQILFNGIGHKIIHIVSRKHYQTINNVITRKI